MGGHVNIEGDKVVFHVSGVDEILAIRRSISVPLAHVVSVSTDKASWNTLKMLRVAGTGLSGVVKDGSFVGPDGKMMFFEMHDPDKCVTVELEDEGYKMIVFEVADKEATAKIIRDAMGQTTGA